MSRRSKPGRVVVSIRKPGPNDGPNLYLWVREPGGSTWHRAKSTGTNQRPLAELQRAELERRLNSHVEAVEQLPEKITLGHAIELHLQAIETLVEVGEVRRPTLTSYQGWASYLEPFHGKVLEELGTKELDQIGASLRQSSLAASTVDRALKHIGTIWRWANEEADTTGLKKSWPGFPRRKVRAASGGKNQTSKRPYTPHEIHLLLEWAQDYQGGRWFPLFKLLAETGARAGEILQSDRSDLRYDESGKLVLVLRVEVVKTGRAREVPIQPDTVNLLLADVRKGPLFLGSRTGKRLDSRSARHALATGLDQSGLRRDTSKPNASTIFDLDLHSFRRSFKAHGERAGIPETILRKIMGHADRDIHEGYGRNNQGDDLHAEVEKVRKWRRAEIAKLEARHRIQPRPNRIQIQPQPLAQQWPAPSAPEVFSAWPKPLQIQELRAAQKPSPYLETDTEEQLDTPFGRVSATVGEHFSRAFTDAFLDHFLLLESGEGGEL